MEDNINKEAEFKTNPYPGPKFEYKLNRFKRLSAQAEKLLAYDVPVALIGDYNVMPTEIDEYKTGALGTRCLIP